MPVPKVLLEEIYGTSQTKQIPVIRTITRYLTTDYVLADLLQRSYDTDRVKTLQRSRDEYEKYLERLDQYGLLSLEDKKLYERYTENPRSFSLCPLNDAVARRNIKISRYRDEKELKQQLEV